MSEKLLKKKIAPESGWPLYCVTKKGREKVEKQRIKLGVDSLAEKWINPLRNLLIRMKKENPNVDLDRYCFTFMGDIPTIFHKSVENMESHIAFERSIWERHQRDLSTVQKKYDEEYYTAFKKGDKAGIARVEAKIEDEVGWRVGSYFRKLLKKAEKEDIAGRLMTLYGLTEEMLEEMVIPSQRTTKKE